MSFPETSLASVAKAGREARDRGDPASANPYPEDTEDHAIWQRAWAMPDGEAAERDAPDSRA